jgi:hypothetical protein
MRFRVRLAVLQALFFLLIALANVSILHAQVFSSVSTSMPAARWLDTATRLQDGTVLIAGGDGTSAVIYNPATQAFTSTNGPMHASRAANVAALLNNGQVLIAGGDVNSNGVSSAELYTPSAGTFTSTGAMLHVRSFSTATLLNNGMVLITGGQDSNGNALSSAELYNPSTNTFTATGNMIQSRYYHTATLLTNGTVLIVGGFGSKPGGVNVLNSAEEYVPSTGQFTPVGNLAAARCLHTATLLANGTVLIAGGADAATEGPTTASAEIYSPSTQSFSATGSLTVPRQSHTATLLEDGTVLIAGGVSSGGGSALSSAEIYKLSGTTGAFTATDNMATARVNHTATLLNNGDVLVAGGGDINFSTATAEIYSYPLTIGALTPKYIVLGVLYSPPGAKSSVTYTQSTALGTSSTLKNTFQSTTSVSTSLGLAIGSAKISGSLSETTSNTWTQQADSTSSYTVNKTTTNAQQAPGPLSSAIGVDHDYDQVLVWVNPKANLSVGNNTPSNILWNGYTYDSNDTYSPNGPDVVSIYIFCLKNPFSNPTCTDNSGRLSRSWDTTSGLGGLTLADYAEIAQRDPFYSNPSYDPSSDTNNRFTYTGQSANYNPAAPGDGANTYSGSLAYSTVASAGQDASDSYQVSYTLDAGIKSVLTAEIKTTNTTTWTNMWSATQTETVGQTAAYSITGPLATDNYQGPTNLEVWQDNVYGTFMFYAPGSTPTSAGSIGVSLGSIDLGSVVVGSISSPVELTLTNNSSVPMFMGVSSAFPFTSSSTVFSPVAAFSDPRFSVVNDSCTGTIVAVGGSCTISVRFSPPASDNPTSDVTISGTMYLTGETDAVVQGTASLSGVEEPISPLRIGFLDGSGGFWIKEGALNATWDSETGGATQIALSGNRIGLLDTSGVFWVKEGAWNSTWVNEGGATQIALSGNRIGLLDTSGVFWVKEGELNATWVNEGGGATQIVLGSNRIGLLDTNGGFWVKEGALNSLWTEVATGATQIAMSGDRLGYLDKSGTYWVNEGALNAAWVNEGGATQIALSSDSLDDANDRIGLVDMNGVFWVKAGALNATWSSEANNVTKIALSGNLLGYLGTNGIYNVQQGALNSSWDAETGGVAQIALTSGSQ